MAELGFAGVSAGTTGSARATTMGSTTAFGGTVPGTAFSVAITGATTTRSDILRISASLNLAAAINTINESRILIHRSSKLVMVLHVVGAGEDMVWRVSLSVRWR